MRRVWVAGASALAPGSLSLTAVPAGVATATDSDSAAESGAGELTGGQVTAAAVEQSLVDGGATEVTVHGEMDGTTVSAFGLPPDIFRVRSMWADYRKNGHTHIVFYGFWDFRDDYINGSDRTT